MSKDYGVYSGLSSDMTGSVKFIMRSDAVESSNSKNDTDETNTKKNKKTTDLDNSDKSLFEKIKDIFK